VQVRRSKKCERNPECRKKGRGGDISKKKEGKRDGTTKNGLVSIKWKKPLPEVGKAPPRKKIRIIKADPEEEGTGCKIETENPARCSGGKKATWVEVRKDVAKIRKRDWGKKSARR